MKKRIRGQHLSRERRERAQEAFLESYSTIGIVRAACLHAGIHRSLVSYWCKHDTEFARRYSEEAREDAHDLIRAELFRRAIQGVEVPLYWQGLAVKDEKGNPVLLRKYSDSLLALMARQLPEYQDRREIDENRKPPQVLVYMPDNGRDPGKVS